MIEWSTVIKVYNIIVWKTSKIMNYFTGQKYQRDYHSSIFCKC